MVYHDINSFGRYLARSHTSCLMPIFDVVLFFILCQSHPSNLQIFSTITKFPVVDSCQRSDARLQDWILYHLSSSVKDACSEIFRLWLTFYRIKIFVHIVQPNYLTIDNITYHIIDYLRYNFVSCYYSMELDIQV